MKKTSLFLVVAFAAMATLYAQTAANPLVGTWAMVIDSSGFETYIYTFNSNGTCTYEMRRDEPSGDGIYDTQVKWTTSGNTLIITFPGAPPISDPYIISGNTLTIGTLKYYRVQRPGWEPNQPSPVGTWQQQTTAYDLLYTFNANGTGTQWRIVRRSGISTNESNFTWTARGNRITLSIDPYGTAGTYIYTYRIINDILTLLVDGTRTLRFKRDGSSGFDGVVIIREDVEVPPF
jgi:hypothetical protein